MIAGPQIVSAVMFATSADSRRNSAAYIAGVLLATTLGISVVFILAGLAHDAAHSSSSSAGKNAISYAVIALLLVLMVRVFVRRKEAKPPKWMERLQEATPRFAFMLGFLLFIAMPTDVITMLAVGSSVAQNSEPWWHILPFVFLTTVLVGVPLLALLVLGQRAEAALPEIRAWMNDNSWVINEAVIAFFLVLTITGLE